MTPFDPLKYWGELAIRLTKENIELRQQLTTLSLQEKMRIMAETKSDTVKDALSEEVKDRN